MTEAQARYPREGEDVTCGMCRGTGIVERHRDWISPYNEIIEESNSET